MSEPAPRPASKRSAVGKLLIEAQGLSKYFYDAGREVQVLRGLNFKAYEAERIAIVGQSGVGKSTLLHVLGSLERPTAGRVLFENQDLLALSPRQLAEFRNLKLGFVFQFHYLLADFSALENVMMPGLIARMPDAEAKKKAEEMLALVGLGDKFHRRPAELSGGEQQRVAVARAVALRPRLVLADEPTGNLDPKTAEEVHVLFERLSELGITFVVATHNDRLARRMHRTMVLRDGQLHEQSAEQGRGDK
ncbi:MAG TPA: ABC transporter ATP-binding protein [Candidatus Binataceae bacterium]|jgi:lipoprotein-releasing system ATP-binding protein|nr:ABC transporter ATP-binding protein [Candidatus Binataceae bacterium]